MGREPRDHRFQVHFSDTEFRTLESLAMRDGVSAASVLRRLLRAEAQKDAAHAGATPLGRTEEANPRGDFAA